MGAAENKTKTVALEGSVKDEEEAAVQAESGTVPGAGERKKGLHSCRKGTGAGRGKTCMVVEVSVNSDSILNEKKSQTKEGGDTICICKGSFRGCRWSGRGSQKWEGRPILGETFVGLGGWALREGARIVRRGSWLKPQLGEGMEEDGKGASLTLEFQDSVLNMQEVTWCQTGQWAGQGLNPEPREKGPTVH